MKIALVLIYLLIVIIDLIIKIEDIKNDLKFINERGVLSAKSFRE